MPKVEINVDINENSLDNSADSELLVVMEDEIYDNKESIHLASQNFLSNGQEENETPYNYRELSGAVTYKLVHVKGEKSDGDIPSHSPDHVIPNGGFYVFTNSNEVFPTSPAPKKSIRRQPLQAKAVTTAKKRDEKRRATHNEVERRRRDKINSWITKLAALVPNSGLPDAVSKGGILAKACDHITELTEKQKRLEKLENDNVNLRMDILRLNQKVIDLRKENISMQQQLANSQSTSQTYHRPRGQKS